MSNTPQPTQHNHQYTGVVDSGASNIYFAKEEPIQNFNAYMPKLHVGTATGQVQKYIVTVILGLTHLLADFLCTGHIIPWFKHKLIVIGSICDAG